MLTGCADKREPLPLIQYTGKPIPALPLNLARTIPDPGVIAGQPDLINLEANRNWGKQCAVQHSETVNWFRKIRATSQSLKP